MVLILICQKNNWRDQAKHHDRHRTLHSLRKGHDDLSVDTVIDLDSNVTKNKLSSSTFLATEIDELEREKSVLSKKSQKERDPDDIVDTKTVTDMWETINRDYSE